MKYQSYFTFFCLFRFISCHSYLTVPTSRTNQMLTQTGCRPPACFGPCDAPKAQAKTPAVQIQRGKTIELTWPRNNHAAGFIRIAWAPTEDSDSHDAFDEMVQLWTCHEMTCKSSNPADPLGGDNDGQAPGTCKSSVVVPSQLTDGNWTMQFVWVGGAFALSDYYSCVDYIVEGGDGATKTLDPLVPEFKGGDVHSAGKNTCLFFNANDVGICKTEPCTTGNKPGKNTGVPKFFETRPNATAGPASLNNQTSNVSRVPKGHEQHDHFPVSSQVVVPSLSTVAEVTPFNSTNVVRNPTQNESLLEAAEVLLVEAVLDLLDLQQG
jgi:hypothetical protein